MMKIPFNTYKTHKGQILPKSPIIANTEEVQNYLKENYKFAYDNSLNMIHNDLPYICVGISASHMGNIYLHISTNSYEDITRYDPTMIKNFTDFESFKKYLNWASKFPRKMVNAKF